MSDQGRLQESQYGFPYHYIPHLGADGAPRVARTLGWGIEYLTYTHMVKDLIESTLAPGGSILDVGCGDGALLNSLGPGYAKHGVDLSARAIAFARAFSTGAVFESRDIFELESSYDMVACVEVLEHIPNDAVAEFSAKLVGLVKKGGHLVLSVPTTATPLHRKHYRHYDEELLSSQMEGHPLALLADVRAYKTSARLDFWLRLMNNQYWTVNYTPLLRRFWQWHKKHGFAADRRSGAHLIRLYQKLA